MNIRNNQTKNKRNAEQIISAQIRLIYGNETRTTGPEITVKCSIEKICSDSQVHSFQSKRMDLDWILLNSNSEKDFSTRNLFGYDSKKH